jgi:SAM-dependent methyltransferase
MPPESRELVTRRFRRNRAAASALCGFSAAERWPLESHLLHERRTRRRANLRPPLSRLDGSWASRTGTPSARATQVRRRLESTAAAPHYDACSPSQGGAMEDEPARRRFEEPESGPTWAERANLAPLEAVLDPADARGGKNRLIDSVHTHALARTVGRVRGSTVLDFGCGTGRLAGWFVEHGAQVDGVDVTPEMVAVARRRVPRGRFETIDGSKLPFADGRFDLVVTAYVLQYYVDGGSSILRELVRVLRRDGRLIAIEQVTESDLGRGGTPAAYMRLFNSAGFTAVDISLIRMSDSRITGAVQRIPVLSRLPGLSWLVAQEAARRPRKPLIDGRYADALFCATKD